MTDSIEPDADQKSPDVLEWAWESAATRIVERCELLANSSDDSGCLTRTFCSHGMKLAHRQLAGWFENSQLEAVLDPVGNLIGRPRRNDDLDCQPDIFMIGSHLDTVINAGKFDGSLGVLLGLGTVEVLQTAGIDLDFDIHVVAFSEEEGVRYQMPFIGSRGIAGTFDQADFDRVDLDGIRMRDALVSFGCQPVDFELASYADRNLIGFVEAHMEQSDLLQDEDLPVGVVSAIAGQTRAKIEFEGQAGHAGTVRQARRRDALAAAAEMVLKVERLGQRTPGLFATVGNVIATPGLSNVISGCAELRLDLRHECDDLRLAAFEKINHEIEQIARSRQVRGSLVSVQHSPAVSMAPAISSQLVSAIKDTGMTAKTMVSGAGHDAMVMSTVAPSCMLFVRSRDGISHHPDEFVSPADIAVALKVMVGAMLRLSRGRNESRADSGVTT